MAIRFFILQTHYRSTLDFSNEALQAAEKGLKRLWEAHEWLKELPVAGPDSYRDQLPDSSNRSEREENETDTELEKKVSALITEFDDFMNDDFNTAKVLANIFELVPVINSMKDKTIAVSALSKKTFELMQKQMRFFIEDIFGLKSITAANNEKLRGVMQLLVDIRKEARSRKDFATSDKIRNQLQDIGISLKDEKDGGISWTIE
jgi:cysteinyl-tRNA synthetase